MAKKYMRSLPKRVAGVKLPKSVRRAAETQLGAAIIAGVMVELGKEALASPPVRDGVAKVRAAVARTAMGIGVAMEHAAQQQTDGRQIEDEQPPRGKSSDKGSKRRRAAQATPDYAH